ncbi:MAG: deoxynucleoside kinase [Prevotellaceae bacterium]|jgi:deoxyadenosine/deoxycytidine kinase|nr:deoxynucleoside kinase [Prevotellaceae bacterium]
MHIAIAGNIGSGKTTLATLLSHHYGWEVRYDELEDNPYLVDFYEDMREWSFNLQIFLLQKRYKSILEIQNKQHSVIQDRTIYEDACIFAPNLLDMGLMSVRDFDTYKSLYNLMMTLLPPPDLLIYLKTSVPTLVRQIQKRGRNYENSIRLDYLQSLNNRYDKWIEEYKEGKFLIINVDDFNFSEKTEDLRTVIDRIDAQINGLFNIR